MKYSARVWFLVAFLSGAWPVLAADGEIGDIESSTADPETPTAVPAPAAVRSPSRPKVPGVPGQASPPVPPPVQPPSTPPGTAGSTPGASVVRPPVPGLPGKLRPPPRVDPQTSPSTSGPSAPPIAAPPPEASPSAEAPAVAGQPPASGAAPSAGSSGAGTPPPGEPAAAAAALDASHAALGATPPDLDTAAQKLQEALAVTAQEIGGIAAELERGSALAAPAVRELARRATDAGQRLQRAGQLAERVEAALRAPRPATGSPLGKPGMLRDLGADARLRAATDRITAVRADRDALQARLAALSARLVALAGAPPDPGAPTSGPLPSTPDEPPAPVASTSPLESAPPVASASPVAPGSPALAAASEAAEIGGLLDRLEELKVMLAGVPDEEARTRLQDAIRQDPSVAAASISTSGLSLSLETRSGIQLVLPDRARRDPAVFTRGPALRFPVAVARAEIAAPTAPSHVMETLPGSARASVLCAFRDERGSTHSVQASRRIHEMLGRHGYASDWAEFTVETLETKVRGAGILYITCHGGEGGTVAFLDRGRTRIDREKADPDSAVAENRIALMALETRDKLGFAIETGKAGRTVLKWKLDPAVLGRWDAELKDAQLALFYGNENDGSPSIHLSVTERWFAAHTGVLADRALVVLDSCFGTRPEAASFWRTFYRQGAGRILGWNNASTDRGATFSELLFAGMLGDEKGILDWCQTQAHRPPDPLLRPFSLDEMLTFAQREGLDLIPTMHPPGTGPELARFVDPAVASPQLVSGGGAPRLSALVLEGVLRSPVGLLRPLIRAAYVDAPPGGRPVLVLQGAFDRGRGTVLVGQRTVEDATWIANTVRIPLEPDDQGNVEVHRNIGDVKLVSNAIPLLAFRTRLQLTRDEELRVTGQLGGLTALTRSTSTWGLRFVTVPFEGRRAPFDALSAELVPRVALFVPDCKVDVDYPGGNRPFECPPGPSGDRPRITETTSWVGSRNPEYGITGAMTGKWAWTGSPKLTFHQTPGGTVTSADLEVAAFLNGPDKVLNERDGECPGSSSAGDTWVGKHPFHAYFGHSYQLQAPAFEAPAGEELSAEGVGPRWETFRPTGTVPDRSTPR